MGAVLRLRQRVVHPTLAGLIYNPLPSLRTNGRREWSGVGALDCGFRRNDGWDMDSGLRRNDKRGDGMTVGGTE